VKLVSSSASTPAATRDARVVLAQANPQWAVFLDVDGCLVDFEPTPEAVHIPPALLDVLQRLHDTLGGALAVVSGRTLDDLDRLFAPLQLPCAGQYGFERRSADGVIHGAPMPPLELVERARRASFDLLRALPGLRVEDKIVSFALHYREAPELAGAVEQAAHAIAATLEGAFEVQEGAMVRELKPVTTNKGMAVNLFRREAPFRDRMPVFLGDDIADESAFVTVNAVGGVSVCIGCARPTQARYTLSAPAEARAWLAELLEVLRTPDTHRQRMR
jgi:trehalose 6-phosphate phosphatase